MRAFALVDGAAYLVHLAIDACTRKSLPLVGTIFRYGKTIMLETDNPAGDVKKPRAVKRPVYEWPVEDIARLRGSFDVFEEQLMVELDITAGLRSGELRGLAWNPGCIQQRRIDPARPLVMDHGGPRGQAHTRCQPSNAAPGSCVAAASVAPNEVVRMFTSMPQDKLHPGHPRCSWRPHTNQSLCWRMSTIVRGRRRLVVSNPAAIGCVRCDTFLNRCTLA